MKTLWKQSAPLDAAFASINRSLEDDWFLISHEIRLQRAHAGTLASAGILNADEHERTLSALSDIERRFADGPCPVSDAEDIHTWIEAQLVDAIGEAGKKIHTARSRNDQVATLLAMYVIESGERMASGLRELCRVCCVRAKAWAPLEFPLQTHTQFAAPGSVGFWILRFAGAFERDRRAVQFCLRDCRRECPLGSGAVAGSSIPIDRSIQAADLGFDGPSLNALDSTSSRDHCLSLLAAGVQIALHLQSFATDVILFSQTPLGWTDYPSGFGTGSSMMPNKTNPDAMELLRGEASAIIGAHAQAVAILKGLPSGYARDLQCIKPVMRDAVEKIVALCGMTTRFVEQLGFNAERLKASKAAGHIDATLRMERMVRDGQTLRDAHHAVAESLQSSGSPSGEPSAGAEAYRTIGSASPAETVRIADEWLSRLK